MRQRLLRWYGISLLAAGMAGTACSGDLAPNDGGTGGNPDAGSDQCQVHVTLTEEGGVTTAIIDASEAPPEDMPNVDTWVYVDLDTGQEVCPATPADSTEWDVAFQRFKIKLNSSIHGTGSAAVAKIESGTFADLTKAPSGPYLEDQVDSDDDGELPDYAFSVGPSSETGPWDYSGPPDHLLSANSTLWVVRTLEGAYFKLEFFDYYNDAGSAGYPKLNWATVDAPLPQGTIELDASKRQFTLFNLERMEVVDIVDPDSSADWDLAFRDAAWKTNSGPERVGLGGAKLAPDGMAYDDIASASTIGFMEDADIPYPAAPGAPSFMGNAVLTDWYDYNSAAHTASSKGLVHLVRGVSGDAYYKLTVVDYDNDNLVYTVKVQAVDRAIETVSSQVDASDGNDWVYVSLRRAEEIVPDDASTDTHWDVGFSRTKVRTNGGSSGAGAGAAGGPLLLPLADITTATVPFVEDALLVDPDDGVTEYSGNPVLAGWYQWSVGTGTTPKDRAFLLHTADGGLVRMAITGYADGVLDVDWAYAGAGRSEF